MYGGRASLNIPEFLQLVDRRLLMLFGRLIKWMVTLFMNIC